MLSHGIQWYATKVCLKEMGKDCMTHHDLEVLHTMFHLFNHKLSEKYIKNVHHKLEAMKKIDEAKQASRADKENIIKTEYIREYKGLTEDHAHHHVDGNSTDEEDDFDIKKQKKDCSS